MTQGLQIWDESGLPVVDLTDRFTRVLGTVDTNYADGSLINNDFLTGTPWFYIYHSTERPMDSRYPVEVVINGNILAWYYRSGYFNVTITAQPIRTNCKIVYGVY